MSTSSVLVLVVVILAACSVVIAINYAPYDVRNGDVDRTPKANVLKPAQGSSLLPSDLPEEAGVKVLKNEETTVAGAPLQYIRILESHQSIDQNLSSYKQYFKEHNYTITSEQKGSDSAFMQVSKDASQISVSMNYDVISKTTKININASLKQ